MAIAVDARAAEFFQKQSADVDNSVCCDSGADEATWVSVSHGIYLSIEAAGVHRSLGVQASFVQSTTMDSWKPQHLKMMELGGNRRFNEFLKEQGVALDMPIREKYCTRAAEWYRKNLKAEAEGLEPLAPLPLGTGHLPAAVCSSSMRHVLDQVFAESPRKGSMSPGGVCEPRFCPEEEEDDDETSVDSASKSFCKMLSDCFKFNHRSAKATQLPESPASNVASAVDSRLTRDLGSDSLPTLLTSPSCPHAKLISFSSQAAVAA